MAYEQKPNTGSLFKNDRKEADTHPDYKGSALIDEHDAAIQELDGDESRRFEEAYNTKESALAKPTPVTAGEFGG